MLGSSSTKRSSLPPSLFVAILFDTRPPSWFSRSSRALLSSSTMERSFFGSCSLAAFRASAFQSFRFELTICCVFRFTKRPGLLTCTVPMELGTDEPSACSGSSSCTCFLRFTADQFVDCREQGVGAVALLEHHIRKPFQEFRYVGRNAATGHDGQLRMLVHQHPRGL